MSTAVLTPREFAARAFNFASLLVDHLRVHGFLYLVILALWYVVSDNYRLGINQTPSLPQTLFVIHKHSPVTKGDYVAFRVREGAKFDPTAILTKIVVGIPGDTVTVRDRVVYVNSEPVGYAKERSLKGDTLDPIDPIVIGKNQLYVMGLHKDSLDSRYTIVGLVTPDMIVGKAYPLW